MTLSIAFPRVWMFYASEINMVTALNLALVEADGAGFRSGHEPIDSAQQAQDNSGAPPEPAGAR